MSSCFQLLQCETDQNFQLNDPFELSEVPPLCLEAVEKIQNHLDTQINWEHNFGLLKDQPGMVIGKMFGVLLVKDRDNRIGYLAAFSGKLANSNHIDFFVPPVFDLLEEGNFFQKESIVINHLNDEITNIENQQLIDIDQLKSLKAERRQRSYSLQEKIFSQYKFLKGNKESKSLLKIFKDFSNSKPPAGAGECAAPKLFHYAFLNNLTPLHISEFWWGASPKSEQREHKRFYPACEEKCRPILTYMLSD